MSNIYKRCIYKLLALLITIPVTLVILLGSVLLWKSPIILLDKLNAMLVREFL